jgi:hypothetical protein
MAENAFSGRQPPICPRTGNCLSSVGHGDNFAIKMRAHSANSQVTVERVKIYAFNIPRI